MKKITLWVGLLLLLFFIVIKGAAAVETQSIYQLYEVKNDIKKEIAESTVNIKTLSDDQTVLKRQKQGDNCMIADEFILDRDYSVVKWERVCEEENTKISGERKGDIFFVKGTFNGENIDKEIELGFKQLYIYPEFSLSKFALSGVDDMKFWTLRRDELTKLPMKAEKRGEETIEINGKKVEAIKIYYAITGKLREKHYNHMYYYRKSDGMLLKREENNGRIEELIKED